MDSNIQVPKFASNSYLRFAKQAPAYVRQWPAIFSTGKGEVMTPMRMQCPADMHMLIWPLKSTNTVLQVAAPFRNGVDCPVNVTTTNLPIIELCESKQTSTTVAGTVDLADGEYIFLPNNRFAEVSCRPSQQSCDAFVLCYVDASNLNQFRDALLLRVKSTAPHLRQHHQQLYNVLTEPKFSTFQQRVPVDTTLRLYYGSSTENEKDAATGANNGEETVTTATGNRRDRRKRAGDFKDWQALSKWNTFIISLTLLKPDSPVLISTVRDGASLQWHSPFVPASSDKTRFGFTVHACPVSGGNSLNDLEKIDDPATLVADTVGANRKSCSVVPFWKEDGNLEEIVDSELLKRTGKESILFRATVRGLAPDTLYQVQVRVLYDQSQSPLSAPSKAFRTAQRSAPTAVVGPLAVRTIIEEGFDVYSTLRKKRVIGEILFGWPKGA